MPIAGLTRKQSDFVETFILAGDARNAAPTGVGKGNGKDAPGGDPGLRAAWQRDSAAFESRLEVLTGHPQASQADPVKTAVAGISDGLAAAQALAAAQDHAGAIAALPGLRTQLEAALALADDHGEIAIKLEDYAARAAALPDPASCTVEQVEKSVAAPREMVADARQAAGRGDLAGALDLLRQVPAAIDRANLLLSAEKTYTARHPRYLETLARIDGLDEKYTGPLAADIALFRDLVVGADIATTGDILVSVQRIGGLFRLENRLLKQLGRLREYVDTLPNFDSFCASLARHKGRFTIETYYQRLLADRQHAVDCATRGEFAMAAKVINSARGDTAKMLRRAELGAKYRGFRKALKKNLAALERVSEPELVAPYVSTARAMRATASVFARRDDWKAAVNLLSHAVQQTRDAQRADQLGEQIADEIRDSLDRMGDDLAPTIDEYKRMRAGIAAWDSDGKLSDFLALGDEQVARACASASESPPDTEAAKAAMIEALLTLSRARLMAAQFSAFGALHDFLRDGLENDLSNDNPDDCITPEIGGMKAALADASTRAAAPDFDFVAAGEALKAADALLLQAKTNRGAYKRDLVPALNRVRDTIDHLRGPDHAAGMGPDIARLESLLQEVRKAYRARNLPLALEKSRKAAGMCDALREKAEACKAAVQALAQHQNDMTLLPRGLPFAADLESRVDDLDAEINRLMADRIYPPVPRSRDRAIIAILRIRELAEANTAYQALRKTAGDALTPLLARDTPEAKAAHDTLAALSARLEAADKLAAIPDFHGAKKQLAGIDTACAEVARQLDQFEDYATRRDAALAELEKINALNNVEAISVLVRRLAGKRDNALALAAAQDFAGAGALFDDLASDCVLAAATAADHARFADVMTQVNDVRDGDADDLRAAIIAAQATLVRLRDHPAAGFAREGLDQTEVTLSRALGFVDTDFATARALLGQAVTACGKLRLELGLFEQLDKAARLALERIDKLATDHPQGDFLRADLDALAGDVTAAMDAVRADPGRMAASQAAIEAALSSQHDLRLLADRHAAYADERDKVSPDIDALETNRYRHVIRGEIAAARKALADARDKALARVHREAMKDLAEARTQHAVAVLRARTANPDDAPPDKGDLERILASPGGDAILDKVITSLEPTAQRKLLNAAFEARFGCELALFKPGDENAGEPEVVADAALDVEAPNIKRFYDLMCKLPNSDTLDNSSLLIFEQTDATLGSSYSGYQKRIAMREGAAATSAIYTPGAAHELGDIEPGCELADGEPVTYFSWNTLHEVGHAVDDKLGFMSRRGAALAGWKVYGANVTPIAKILADKFGYDENYIALYMTRRAPKDANDKVPNPAMPDPDGVDPDEWNRRRIDVEIWIDRARASNRPWQSDSTARACAFDNVVYQESYEHDWTSYDLGARRKGVTAYQFRAPGEWFSELYACFHTGKMKRTHPAHDWLKDL